MIEILKRHGLTVKAIFAACTTGLTAVVYHDGGILSQSKAALETEIIRQVIPTSLYNNHLMPKIYLYFDR